MTSMSPASRAPGFTMVELIVIMVIIGIVAVVLVPLSNPVGMRAAAFNDEVRSALRLAQKSATSHRRLVCAQLNNDNVTLRIATTNPAIVCCEPYNTSGDTTPAARSQDASVTLVVNITLPLTTTPPTLFFQPSGTITRDGAGATPVTNLTITVTGQTPITIEGATGYVN